MSEAYLEKTTHSDSQRYREPLRQSPYIATTTQAIKNYKENWAGAWFKENVDASDPAGNFAFQRLRHTWFTPKIDPESDSGAMTNFTLSVHVLCAALKRPENAQDRCGKRRAGACELRDRAKL